MDILPVAYNAAARPEHLAEPLDKNEYGEYLSRAAPGA